MDSTPLSFFSSGSAAPGWFIFRRNDSFADGGFNDFAAVWAVGHRFHARSPVRHAYASGAIERYEGLEIGAKFRRDSPPLFQVGTRFGPSDSTARGALQGPPPAAPRVQRGAAPEQGSAAPVQRQCSTKVLDLFSLKIDPMEVWDSSPDVPPTIRSPGSPVAIGSRLKTAG